MKGIALRHHPRWTSIVLPLLLVGALGLSACAPKSVMRSTNLPQVSAIQAPSPDPRVGLEAGLFDAEEAIWNLRKLSSTPPPEAFLGVTNSDLAFKGNYAFQGNYNGIQVWDISNPSKPALVTEFVCPASQSDVSVYGDLMFVSGEGLGGRLDCGTQGIQDQISQDRLRGIRIFNIKNIREPEYIANVQTCRGSHTHSLLKDPNDNDNVYIYVSGSAPVRPAEELPGCVSASPDEDPNSALFRIEVIKVPLEHPEQAAIVSSPRIFENLTAPPQHGASPADIAEMEAAKASGAYVVRVFGQDQVVPSQYLPPLMNAFMAERGGGEPTAADSAAFREDIQRIAEKTFGFSGQAPESAGPGRGPTQCHDITLYPAIGRAGGACEGYGLLLDITDPVNPKRMDAVADSNFSYWHSATFNNDGSKILFSDEWGGGGQPKCRAEDPMEWGANAIFTVNNGTMAFKSYYKMPAPQTSLENCVAHNGSLIPVPGRDIMVQSWYQGGISVFDWTDASNPIEIAFHDRGPSDPDEMGAGGTWSVYWYNGLIVSSEIARGLDIFELVPSPALTANEIAAAKSVKLDYLNAQGQPEFVWPSTYALAHAYLDQLARDGGLAASQIGELREELAEAEKGSGKGLAESASMLSSIPGASPKVSKLAAVLSDLARMGTN